MVLTGAYNVMLMEKQDGTYLSRLTIHNVTERHTGLYMCSDGVNHVTAFLRVILPSQLSFLQIKTQPYFDWENTFFKECKFK